MGFPGPCSGRQSFSCNTDTHPASQPLTLSDHSDFVEIARHLANVDPIGADCTYTPQGMQLGDRLSEAKER